MPEDPKSMRVLSLKSQEGFMRILACDVKLSDGAVTIAGKNRQGKSSILNMVQALKGKRFLPDSVLHDENTKGDFTIVMGAGAPEFTVKYTFTKKGAYLSVTELGNGKKLGNAQEVLTGFVSPLLDPWEFVRMLRGSPADQRKAYETVIPLMEFDFNVLDMVKLLELEEDKTVKTMMTEHEGDLFAFFKAFEALITDYRKRWKDEVARIEGVKEGLLNEIPAEKRAQKTVDVLELLHQKEALQEQERARESAQEAITRAYERMTEAMSAVTIAKQELASKEQELATMRDQHAALDQAEKELPDPPLHVNSKQLDARIRSAQEDNALAGKVEQLAKEQESLTDAQANLTDFANVLDEIRAHKKKAMSSAKGPIEGFTVDDEGAPLLHGQPLATNSSDEECLSFAIDVAMAKAKQQTGDHRLDTLICKHANLLDGGAREVLEQKMEEHGFQCLLEEVADEKRPGVIFVEGGIAVNTEEEKGESDGSGD